MRTLLFIFSASFLLVACTTNNSENTSENLEQLARLENKVLQLELDNEMKDSMLNESISFFNEIQRNLATIQLKEDEIRDLTRNPEKPDDSKAKILQEIQYINYLRTENTRKINLLQNQLQNTNLKNKQFVEMISRLEIQLKDKEQEIEALQIELQKSDIEYAKMFDRYQEEVLKNENLRTELNTVYFALGSLKELTKNGVITQIKGFAGLGKKVVLKEDFNENYFSKSSIQESVNLPLSGKNIRLISDHPSFSYKIEKKGETEYLKITNSDAFWKVSNYLVLLID